MTNPPTITLVYDGLCRLCSWGVSWVLPRIPADRIRYLPAQSDEGAAIMARAGINAMDPSTVIVTDGTHIMTKSRSIIFLLRACGGMSRATAWFLALFPAGVTDTAYDWLAANRYRLFGKRTSCFIPSNPKD